AKRLLGVGVVQSAMAAFAGGAFTETEQTNALSGGPSFRPVPEGPSIERDDITNEPASQISDLDGSGATAVQLDKPAIVPSEPKGSEGTPGSDQEVNQA